MKLLKLNDQSINSSNELWLAIHLPLLPLVAPTPNNTDLSTVMYHELDYHHRITFDNSSTEENDMELNMLLPTANNLVNSIKVMNHNLESEELVISKLAKLAQSWSPKVVIHSNKLILFEIGRCLLLHGGLTSLIKSINKSFPISLFGSNISVTPTPASAILLAELGYDTILTNHIQLASFFRQLPINDLGLEKKQQFFLKQIGINKISNLLRLPRNDLAIRMGVNFLKKVDNINNKTHPQLIHKFQPYFEVKIDFEMEIYFIKPLLLQAAKFLTKLEHFLKTHRSSVDFFEWRLYKSDYSYICAPICLSRPRQEVKSLINLTKLVFESKLLVKEGIIQLALHAKPIPILVTKNISILKNNKAYQSDQSDQLLNQLYLRLGYSAVKIISCNLDHRPECAWTKLAPGIKVQKIPSINKPLWLFNSPKSLFTDNRRPIFHGALELSQHERIVTGWWDNNPIQRDYYLAKSNQGLIWIFRELKNNIWYMHGLF